MNLEEIFTMQKALDKKIANKILEQDKENIETKMAIALIVELAEFANEIKTFKYWKIDKSTDREKILEEFADGIHFLTSMAYKTNLNSEIKLIFKSQDFNLQLAYTFKIFTKLLYKFNKRNIKKAYGLYLALGKLANIEYEDIIQSYLKKNAKNYQRIEENY
ncbi:dUTP diphosphatase [Mycoplasma struthionis]|uniref:dUTP diphosphatase n=1 Tax=Mycoplasma struthionis TaxID=538220 RepID=A0A3G8LI85_9MOLU|nr:dUTP diphosphatase [Mycoplasma struthionis]AZG68590.1 hypothetical protein EGN60_01220 [Mycoplasma struthionis]TPI02326.1 hypothetical protein FJM01_01070 [Mycoplasma struthionis]